MKKFTLIFQLVFIFSFCGYSQITKENITITPMINYDDSTVWFFIENNSMSRITSIKWSWPNADGSLSIGVCQQGIIAKPSDTLFWTSDRMKINPGNNVVTFQVFDVAGKKMTINSEEFGFDRKLESPFDVFLKLSSEANKLRSSAIQLRDQKKYLEALRAISDAAWISDNNDGDLAILSGCAFGAGKYEDVAWSIERISKDVFMGTDKYLMWGISVAVLNDYEKADSIMVAGLNQTQADEAEFLESFREWHIVFTYLNKDFFAARELARTQPGAFGDAARQASSSNSIVYDLLAKKISSLCGMADGQGMHYPLLSHLSQAHRLIRDGVEIFSNIYGDADLRQKGGEYVRNLAWRIIDLYRSLPLKPLPPPNAIQKYTAAMDVFNSKPISEWDRNGINVLIDITRMVPWWADVHYNLAMVLKDYDYNGQRNQYYDYNGVRNQTIAAQELMFYLGLEPKGEKADEARKILKEWNQPVPR